MNYIGNISILDRGDGPAQAVIDRNARALAQRTADETRDELNKVMSRVHTIYSAMDNTDDSYPTSATMEYLNDLTELEEILKDEIKKRQYQQQVTVFVVGFQEVSHQKLVLLQQVNEFFMENSKRIDEEDWFPTTPDLDLEEMAITVDDTLTHAHELTNRLAELNQDMVEYIASMAEKKASHKGRKKIEKALQQARDEVNGLSEKLLRLQTDLDDREEKVQSMFKQLEIRNMEVQKFRTAAELAKKTQDGLETMADQEVGLRDAKILAQRQQLSKMEVALAQSNLDTGITQSKLNVTDVESQQKIIMLQRDLEEQKKNNQDIETGMSKLMDSQINTLLEGHQREMEELKKLHETGAQTLQESRPSAKDTKVSSKSLATGKQSKASSKSPSRLSKSNSRSSGAKSGKEFAEVAVQDEGGDPATAVVDKKTRTPATRSKCSKSALAPVVESDLDNAFDLFDENAWAGVPSDQINIRFSQYRKLSTRRLQEVEEQLELVTARTQRKVSTLKAQFLEHKIKWQTERRVLMEQVDQTLKMQTDAEKEADAAMTQLEDFISEQEGLEQEEEDKRNEIIRSSVSLTPQDPRQQTPPDASADKEEIPTAGTPHLPPMIGRITPEVELQKLMQQTDDAKVQEMNARLGFCVSAPPAVHMEGTPAMQSTESLSSAAVGARIESHKAEEELRTSSALSRASLRESYKVKLDEAKNATEDRRFKSPVIHLPTKLTVDEELILDDVDDEETTLPQDAKGILTHHSPDFLDYEDPSIYDIGTSPPPQDEEVTWASLLSQRANDGDQPPRGVAEPPVQQVSQKIIRQGIGLLEHPLLKEFLKAYDNVVSFKDNMGKMLLDKDMMSVHQLTCDLETLTFDPSHKAMPQVEELTRNIAQVLDEMIGLINSILVRDREPPVSSLNLLSREPTQKSLAAPSGTDVSILEEPVVVAAENRRGSHAGSALSLSSHHSSVVVGGHGRRSSNASDKVQIRELEEQCTAIKQQLGEATQSHEDQLHRNTVLMMQMQDTIGDLQRELSTLGMTAKRTSVSSATGRGSPAVHAKPWSAETSVMFTRLDSERNSKIMKKAVMEEKLEPEKYKEAVSKMDEYVNLPAQRLSHLVRKYVHHTRMRTIEEKVKNSSSLNQDVFDVLNKMEDLQNERARQWAARMDDMGLERLRLANLLMSKLDTIEQESGIFLIKPMYSYRGRDVKPGHTTKLSRPMGGHRSEGTPSYDGGNSMMPAPTPASNYRLVKHDWHPQHQQQISSSLAKLCPSEMHHRAPDDDGTVRVTCNAMTISAEPAQTTWNMQTSQSCNRWEGPANSFNTPRILELDINRMLIGQNNISSYVPYPPSDDRLINANLNKLRSYVTVNRPTATFGGEGQDRRHNPGHQDQITSIQPNGAKNVRVSVVDREMIPPTLLASSPLPPITPDQFAGHLLDDGVRAETDVGISAGEQVPPSVTYSDVDENEPSQSPPGTSPDQYVHNRVTAS